jgi:S-adenosylmethionine uptake transporter
MIRNPSLQGALLSLAAFGVYALCDMMIKFMGQSMFAVQIIFTASLCSLPFIVLHAAVAKGGFALRPLLPGWTMIRVGLVVVNSVIVSYTFTKLPVGQAYAIFFCMPLLITLLAGPLLKERIDLTQGLAIAVGFAGVLIAVRPGSTSLQLAHLTGIIGACLGAVNSLMLRKIGDKERPAVVLLYPALAQVAILAAFLPWIWQPMSGQSWTLAGAIGFLSTLGGVMLIKAYVRAPAAVVSPMQYSQIIWGSICGAIIFGERMDTLMISGIVVIICAGSFLLWKSGQDPKST